MKFTWNGDAQIHEFDGPPIREGLLAGFTVGELRWAKKELNVPAIEQIDAIEARLLYYVLTMRRVDHTLLPIARFDTLTLLDFELVQHWVEGLDRDGDCGECSQPIGSPIHYGSRVPVDPTVAGQDQLDLMP